MKSNAAKVLPFPGVKRDGETQDFENGQGGLLSRTSPAKRRCKGDACPAPAKPKKLGEYLMEAGIIDASTLEKALLLQQKSKAKLGEILVEMGVVDDTMLARTLARQQRLHFVRLAGVTIPQELVRMIPPTLAHRHGLLPLKMIKGKLAMAMVDPKNVMSLQDARFVTNCPILPVFAPFGELLEAIARHYGPAVESQKSRRAYGGISQQDKGVELILSNAQESEDPENAEELAKRSSQSPIVKLFNSMLANAIERKASDIHIEPTPKGVMVRFRVDGMLQEVILLESHVQKVLISRIKIVSNMDIAVRLKPQDGKVRMRYHGHAYDLRVSTIPTAHGEKVVIRILDQNKGNTLLEEMNLPLKVYDGLTGAIGKSAGVLLVTGPTGSGKSTTLYSCLQRIKSPALNIITVEDPVEYELAGINQVQIKPKAGLTFASALRSILRQDPDIIMVGEIRDPETASIAIEAAQTGHLVFSTLHTNDAPSAISRLSDLGVEPFMIGSALQGVLAQRLVRKLCPHCAVPDPEAERLLAKFPKDLQALYREAPFQTGKGCKACGDTGYRGRMGIYEFVESSPELIRVIAHTVNAEEVLQAAEKSGYRPMAADGLAKAAAGITSLQEVMRVAMMRNQSPELASDESTMCQPSGALPCANSRKGAFPGRRIVLADDNAVVRKLVGGILNKMGHEVLTAENGMDALQTIFRERPDMVVTDLMMPDMDGLSLLKKLKLQVELAGLPVIMLTAKEEKGLEEKVLKEGAFKCLKKPVDHARLRQAVQEAIDAAGKEAKAHETRK